MKAIYSLQDKLSHLQWNKARLILLSQFILALIKTRINFTTRASPELQFLGHLRFLGNR